MSISGHAWRASRRVSAAGTVMSLVVACGGAPRQETSAPMASASAVPTMSAVVSAVATAPPPPSSVPSVKPPRAETIPELAHFYAALRGLEDKTRKSHVRVYWMGDSHAQADFWSGALREVLQARFGDAGPGFVHVGYKDYRHDGVKFTTHGRWRMRPKKPSGVKREGDGAFGLGGIAMGGYADQPSAFVDVTRSPNGSLVYDLCYRLKSRSDTIEAAVSGGPKITIGFQDAEKVGVIRHAVFHGVSPGSLELRPTAGSPDFCGATIETDPASAPGVVLDTLGINGARYATALAWDEQAWEAEVTRRPPDLVVFEYGTNEAGGPTPAAEKTGANADLLVARVRAVKADVDCVMVSATDRADAEERVPLINEDIVGAAKRNGCLYFDAYEALGGKGSMSRMRDEAEPRAQPDGIHMTIKGYREIGRTLADMLLKGY